jgi:hypothetical protein
VNLPNQIHQRVTDRGFDFNIMAIGSCGRLLPGAAPGW